MSDPGTRSRLLGVMMAWKDVLTRLRSSIQKIAYRETYCIAVVQRQEGSCIFGVQLDIEGDLSSGMEDIHGDEYDHESGSERNQPSNWPLRMAMDNWKGTCIVSSTATLTAWNRQNLSIEIYQDEKKETQIGVAQYRGSSRPVGFYIAVRHSAAKAGLWTSIGLEPGIDRQQDMAKSGGRNSKWRSLKRGHDMSTPFPKQLVNSRLAAGYQPTCQMYQPAWLVSSWIASWAAILNVPPGEYFDGLPQEMG
ncbi:hypothetical protein C8R45DRAFT_928112 [Mycena sanguinolenta]|nr:hypothetical protein C8R45DRAFT_928112 [Mycena sanguinolenta]